MPDQNYNTGDGLTPVDTGDGVESNSAPQYREDNPAPQYSPFDATEAPGISVVLLMRIYDVLMAQLTVTDKAAAKDLFELHANGGIIGSLPVFNPDYIKS